MKIKTILDRNRNDFTAIMECEHCHRTQKLLYGYEDSYYHTFVIPAQHCKYCGKNRAGQLRGEGREA